MQEYYVNIENRGEIAGFWNHDSTGKRYSCPSCDKAAIAVPAFVKVVG
jgi:hypothetical protein